MRFETLQRLKEVQDRLGPVLDDLRVKAKLKREEDWIAIKFQSDDGSIQVPITLYLHPNAMYGGDEASWEGTEVEIQEWHENPFTAGWVANSFSGQTTSIYLGPNDDENFQALTQAIRESGVVYLGRSHVGRTDDEYFADAYDHLRNALLSEDDEEVACLRENAFDSLNFTDPSGQRWKIAFQDLEAIVSIAGAEVTRFRANEPKQLSSFILNRIRKQKGLDKAFKGGPGGR